jgi:LysR family transcriptional regulator, regulator for metE and metH
MEIRHFKLIKAVVEEQNLTKAAERLFLSQSALSHQLKEIEQAYQTQFFIRVNKKMILSPSGERLLQSADLVLNELEKLKTDLKQLNSPEIGNIRFTTECYTCYHWLSTLLRKYNAQFPQVEINIVTEATHSPIRFLETGKVDVAVMIDFTEKNPHLKAQKLFFDELVAIFPPHHAWRSKTFVEAEDFAQENYFAYSTDLNDSFMYQNVFKPQQVMPKKMIEMQLTEGIIQMVKAGLGVSALAKWAVQPYLDSGELIGLPIGKKGFIRTWSAVQLRDTPKPLYLQKFVDMLGEHFQPCENAICDNLSLVA